ncbi:myosin heavy chain kinase B [Dorcoceras hygrometricum]|uniref:Myosin heavy chain kinase B n=1 Tax=Dorcoceras hygrometricum TaxID=472368 RepID=A0A2Z7C8Y7_9LAMI|nr:myosin heavy chain kinase B [Dorcoceras hygrometricum]
MANENVISGAVISLDQNNLPRTKFGPVVCSDSSVLQEESSDDLYHHFLLRKNDEGVIPKSRNAITCSTKQKSCEPASSACFVMFPWSQSLSNSRTKWPDECSAQEHDDQSGKGLLKHGLIGNLVYEGHIYSLAASGDFLYTGSDKKHLRVWRNLKDFSGLKSGSGLVKAIVVMGDKIFTGHQDGKIRIWRFLGDKRTAYERIGNLPTTRDLLTKSFNPRNYVAVKRNRTGPWIKHHDAVSCMSVDIDHGLLYSGSWDKTLKVWRISDSKCLESIQVHKDAVNSLVAAFDVMVFTGSADGTVKSWRRQNTAARNRTKHVMVEVLLKQRHAVTSLAANQETASVYAGSSDGLVNFWEREDKDFMSYGGVLRGHKQAVLCLAVGGNLVLSGSADKNICVWRREGGGIHSFVAVLSGHSGPVKCLAAEEDGDQRWIVYSGSLDKSVKVWRVSERTLKLRELN